MKLADLLANPSNPHTLATVHHYWTTAALDNLSLPGLENLNRNEKVNLLTHLVTSPYSWNALDINKADAILAQILSSSSDDNYLVTQLLTASASLAGDATAQWLDANPSQYDPTRMEILWRVRGLDALPAVAKTWTSLERYMMKHLEPNYDGLRQSAGISKAAWDLLLYPWEASADRRKKAIGEFSSMVEKGTTMPVADWKLLTTHPVHAEVVNNLVLAIEGGGFFTPPDWPTSEGSISIAHPSMLSETQITEWKARIPKPTFDQWKASKQATLKLDPVGLTAQPAELLLHLEACGWIRGRAGREDGCIRTHTKTFPDIGVTAEIEYGDGVPTKPGGRWKPQTIRAYRFYRQSHGTVVAANEVHPIALASVMADLAPLQKS